MAKQPRIHSLLDSMADVFALTIDTDTSDELLHIILSEALRLTEAQAGSILLYDKKRDELYFKYSLGGTPEEVSHLRLPRGKGLGWQAILKNKTLSYSNVSHSPYYFKDIKKFTNYRTVSMILAPLSYKSHLFGVIELLNKGETTEPFTPVDVRILELFSQYAAIALKMVDYQQEVIQKERWAAIGHATSSVAHYIKNILTSVQGANSILERSLKNDNLEESKINWNILSRNIDKLYRFTLNLLRYSTQKKPTLELKSINSFLKIFVRDFKDSYQGTTPLHFYFQLGSHLPRFYFDMAVLTDVFYNLLLNSIEAFHEEDNELKVRVQTSFNKKTQTVFIEYEDNGPGFADEDLDNLFEPFKRLSTGQGHGLGLATVKLNIEQLGGQFWLDNRKKHFDKGILFVIALPLLKDKQPIKQDTENKEDTNASSRRKRTR